MVAEIPKTAKRTDSYEKSFQRVNDENKFEVSREVLLSKKKLV